MTKTKLTEKPANGQMGLALKNMEHFAETLTANQTTRCRLENEGRLLLDRVANEGMDERLLEECLDHVARCARARNEMHESRRPFTDALQQLQKRFVAEENAIDPQKRDSPAFALAAHARSYYQARLDEAAEREERLARNHAATSKRVERRTDWSDEQKRAALQRADARLIEGRRAINATAPAVELVPVARCPEAYAELFLFWFENHGKSLPDAELRRLLHPMLQFAKKAAARGLKLRSERVAYEAVPKLGKDYFFINQNKNGKN